MKKFRLPIPQTFILVIYTLITGLLIAYKYSHFLYTQLDLAIFANALRQPWSNLLYSTLQGHHYFGDHFMPYLVLLKPILDLFKQSSIFLLSLQVVMIASAAWPLQKLLNVTMDKKYHAMFFALFFLNPLAINIALYEFHPELLYIPLVLWAVYFFTVKNYSKYIFSLIAILLMREDSLLAILPFTFLALFEKRSWKWWIAPLFSIPYLFISLKIINYFNPQGQSLFLRFYAWMGDSLSEIIINAITQPWMIIQHLSTIYVFEFVIGGLMLFLFLPLFSPRYLIIGLFSYLSLALGLGQDVGIYHSHYSSVIFPALITASIFGFKNIITKYKNLASEHGVFLWPLIIISLIYFHTSNLSPFPSVIAQYNDSAFRSRVQSQRDALNAIDLNLPTVASYQYLDRIKSPELYFIGYAVQQLQQFQIAPYHIPETTVQSALDLNDLFTFGVRTTLDQYRPYEQEFVNIMDRFPIQFQQNGLVVGRANNARMFWEREEYLELEDEDEYFKFIKYLRTPHSLKLSGILKKPSALDSPIFAKIDSLDASGKVINISYQNFGQGASVSSDWENEKEYFYDIEINIPDEAQLFKISLVTLKGAHVLSSLGTSKLMIDQEKIFSTIELK